MEEQFGWNGMSLTNTNERVFVKEFNWAVAEIGWGIFAH